MWEKYPGIASSNHTILRGFIYRAREQADVGDGYEAGRCALFQGVVVDIREPARRSRKTRMERHVSATFW